MNLMEQGPIIFSNIIPFHHNSIANKLKHEYISLALYLRTVFLESKNLIITFILGFEKSIRKFGKKRFLACKISISVLSD